jgi:hypothetical protein
MVRQCAWCLRLINSAGKRLSPLPLPKLYEASHGICGICGMQWIEQVLETDRKSSGALPRHGQEADTAHEDVSQEIEYQEMMTQLALQLQDHVSPVASTLPPVRRSNRMRI